jgi:G3E family GTPase
MMNISSSQTPLVLLTGFLGAGKTTFLQNLVTAALEKDFVPHVILNDYENADVDATSVRRLTQNVKAVSGSCVCCDSRDTLLDLLEALPRGGRNVAIVETNGTTDPVRLLEELSCDRRTRMFSVKQVAVVDTQRWGLRRQHNALEAQQVKTASHLFLSYRDIAEPGRFENARDAIQKLNPRLRLTDPTQLVAELDLAVRVAGLPFRSPAPTPTKTGSWTTGLPALPEPQFDHQHAHAFASAQLTIPPLVEEKDLMTWLAALPPEALRVKGVTMVAHAPGELCCFQRIEDKATMKLFPLPEGFNWQPLAVVIGSWLPKADLQQLTDDKLPHSIRLK